MAKTLSPDRAKAAHSGRAHASVDLACAIAFNAGKEYGPIVENNGALSRVADRDG